MMLLGFIHGKTVLLQYYKMIKLSFSITNKNCDVDLLEYATKESLLITK